MSIESILHGKIERLGNEYIQLLQQLVQIPSITGEEQQCQTLVMNKMQDLGIFDKEIFPSNNSPFHPTDRVYEVRPCIVGKLAGTGGSHFILNAHIDTAPVENEKSWIYPPFSAVIEDNKLFGRGALDDKAGIAIMLLLGECLLPAEIKLPGDLYFESVIEDEDSGNGTLACTLAGYRCDGGIIIDGTWPFRVIDSHLGQIWLEIEISGVPVAACSQKRGINPIDLAFRLIGEITDLVRERNKVLGPWLNIEEPFFLNVGKIRSGKWAGAVPEQCFMEVQIGFAPPYTAQAMAKDISEVVKGSGDHYDKIGIRTRIGNLCTDPFSNFENKMIKTIKSTISRLRGDEMPVLNNAVTGHCDLRHLLKSNGQPADACLYGPGGGSNPHVRDEYYLLDHFIPVAQNIGSAILDWYGIT